MLCENFKYPKLLKYFEEISAIPRPSYHEEKIAEYLVDFAKSRGLEYHSDKFGNVLINIPATEDCKDKEPILLQGHTDMVCEKNEGVEHDFLTDPLKLRIKDGWISAEGTTLGADNGVAVAAMLAILDGEAESHRSLQCLFTASEEVGLDGVKGFDYSKIYARKMINMDSADEKLIIAGCAGGLRSSMILPIEREPYSGSYLKIQVRGLAGGHSGEDIHRGRENANKLLGRVLNRLCVADADMRLVSVSGGSKENAIPRESEALIVTQKAEELIALCKDISAEIFGELSTDDRNFTLKALKAESTDIPMTRGDSEKIIFALATLANGVFAVGRQLSGIVEFSRNLGVMKTDDNEVELVISSRSARESQLDTSIAELDAYAKMLSGRADHYNRYPGWVYAEESEIRDEYINSYREIFGTTPDIEVIHAGLECGIIKKEIPDMDMLSCGPDLIDIHSPDERMSMESFAKIFSVVLDVIK